MNRQIKFRVWTGYSMEYRILAGALGHFYVEGMSKTDSACLSDANTIYHESAPLMQFTGLLDKNGKEIWEGDIVNCKYTSFVLMSWEKEYRKYDTIEVVKFDFSYLTHLKHLLDGSIFKEEPIVEVIGNIHANPELLK